MKGWYGEWKYNKGILEVSVFHCGVKAKLIPPDPDDENDEGLFVCRKCGAAISADFLSAARAAFIGCDLTEEVSLEE